MNWLRISKKPNLFTQNGVKCHESLLRSFQILEAVKELLKLNTPAEVILQAIDVMESGESSMLEVGDEKSA